MSYSAEQGIKIPVIDLSCLLAKNEFGHNARASRNMLENLRNACEEWGCFLVVNHGIPSDIIRKMDIAARRMFELPKETKKQNIFSSKSFSYADLSTYHESLGVPGVPDPQEIQLFTQQLWPEGNRQICKTIEEYTSSVNGLTNSIIKLIYKILGVSKYYESHKFFGLLRMNYYDFSKVKNEKTALTAHVDSACITVMYQDAEGGLEVRTKAKEWVKVKPKRNSFVVFMGTSFKVWTNGRIHNVKHRVTREEECQTPRVSLPYFTHFPREVEIRPAPEFVDDQHPPIISRFVYPL